MINPLHDYHYTKGNIYVYYWERYTEDYVTQYWRKYRNDILACGYYLSSKALYNSCVPYSLTSSQEGYCKVTLNSYGDLLNPYAKLHNKLARTLWVMLHTIEMYDNIANISKYETEYMFMPTKKVVTPSNAISQNWTAWLCDDGLTIDSMKKMGYYITTPNEIDFWTMIQELTKEN